MSKINEENTYRLTNLAISYWNCNIRITTTPNSTVSSVVKGSLDWSQCPLSSQQTKVCCPDIVSTKLECYVSCPNVNCRKKINIIDGDAKTITCIHCKHKTLMKRCTVTYSIDIVIEKEGKQTKLTAFPEYIENFLNHDENPLP